MATVDRNDDIRPLAVWHVAFESLTGALDPKVEGQVIMMRTSDIKRRVNWQMPVIIVWKGVELPCDK